MEKTECYKCQAEISVPDKTVVHPLCESCESAFDDWFTQELNKLTKKGA